MAADQLNFRKVCSVSLCLVSFLELMAELCLRMTLKGERLLIKSDYTGSYAVFLHFIYWARFSITEHITIHLEFQMVLKRWDKCSIKYSVLLIPPM